MKQVKKGKKKVKRTRRWSSDEENGLNSSGDDDEANMKDPADKYFPKKEGKKEGQGTRMKEGDEEG